MNKKGDSRFEDDNDELNYDLSEETLCDDVVNVLNAMFRIKNNNNNDDDNAKLCSHGCSNDDDNNNKNGGGDDNRDEVEIPPLVLIGHSMGGAIVSKVAYGYKNHYLKDDNPPLPRTSYPLSPIFITSLLTPQRDGGWK